jgi:hypothetical protein
MQFCCDHRMSENAYHRGYIQGARAILEATKPHLPESRYHELYTRIDCALSLCRYSRLRPTTLPTRPPLPPRAPLAGG